MSLCSKQSSLFSFYALPSGGKSKGAVVHWKFFVDLSWRHVLWLRWLRKKLDIPGLFFMPNETQ